MTRWQNRDVSGRPVSLKAVPRRGHTCTTTLLKNFWKLVLWNALKISSTSLNILNEGNISSSKSVVLKLDCASELPGGLVKCTLLGSTPKVSDPLNLGWGPGFVFLKSSQVILMLLVPGHTLRTTILRNLFLERVNHLKPSSD